LESYQITDLERITGIKAHTIRIWEKRYNLIQPKRTATNIRYYDDSQVRKLLNVSSLLENGYKISSVAALSDVEINDIVSEISSTEQKPTDAIGTVFINNLVGATIAYDETAFERIFTAALTRFGMHNTMLQVIYPYLIKIGILWRSDKITSIQEHFASNLIRRKLIAAIDGLPLPYKQGKKFLLALPPDEWHELALLFADYIIKAAGYTTIYLGQSVPHHALHTIITDTSATHLLTFYITSRWDTQKIDQLCSIRDKCKGLKMLIGGEQRRLNYASKPQGFDYLHSAEDLFSYL